GPSPPAASKENARGKAPGPRKTASDASDEYWRGGADPMTKKIDSTLRPELNPVALAARSTEAPQQVYARLLRECPVAQVGEQEYAVFRMADILAINRHPDIRGEGGLYHPLGTAGAARPLIPLDLDGPDHTKYRKILDPLFAP